MVLNKFLIVITTIMLVSCHNNNNITIELSNPEIYQLDQLPSASGVSIYNDTLYIVGDDSPWLYTLDQELNIVKRTQIAVVDSSIVGRVPKKKKSDFECTELIFNSGHMELLIISSGSLMHTRDTAFIIRIESDNQLFKKNIRPLFEKIVQKARLNSKNEINIEGITISKDHAYLLHRGNVSENIIIRMDRQKFIDYIKTSNLIPDIEIYNFDLPNLDGVSSGFSGACITPDSTGIIFTASMEKTNDEINDGEILGSYIGVIPFSDMELGGYYSSLLMKDGLLMSNKLEGISVVPNKENTSKIFNLITVCDNDNGTSEIIKIKMKLNPNLN